MDGINFEVNFEILNPDVKQIEYLRLILNFISTIYLVSGETKEENRVQIRYFLKCIADSGDLLQGLNKFKDSITLVKNIPNSSDKKEIQATLIYQDMQTRSVFTKIPLRWYPDQLSTSINALILASIQYFDEHQQNLLYKSLKNLSDFYYTAPNSKSVTASMTFPNKAFFNGNN